MKRVAIVFWSALLALLVGLPLHIMGAPAQSWSQKRAAKKAEKKRSADRAARKVIKERRRAARQAGRLRDEKAVPELIESLKDSDADVRLEAAVSLGAVGANSGKAGLKSALKDKDKRVVYSATRSLGILKDKDSIEDLKGLASAGSADEREPALTALVRIGTPEAVAAVAGHAKDKDAATAAIACRSLQWSDSEGSLAALNRCIKREETEVQASAAFALARHGRMEGLFKAVKPLLNDAKASIRVEAVQTLGLLGSRNADVLPLLVEAQKTEKDPLVLQILDMTVNKLTR